MIAVDTSTFIAYFKGDKGFDVELLDQAFQDRKVVLVPVVLTELFSSKKMYSSLKADLDCFPVLELHENYWEKVGHLRAKLFSLGHKAKLGDSLVAQSCLDHNVPLITRDKDFRIFEKIFGLKLYDRHLH